MQRITKLFKPSLSIASTLFKHSNPYKTSMKYYTPILKNSLYFSQHLYFSNNQGTNASSIYEPIKVFSYEEIIKYLKFDNAEEFKKAFNEYQSCTDVNSVSSSSCLLMFKVLCTIGGELTKEKLTEPASQFFKQAVLFGGKVEHLLGEHEKSALDLLSNHYAFNENTNNVKETLKNLLSQAHSFQTKKDNDKALQILIEGIELVESSSKEDHQASSKEISLLYKSSVEILEQQGDIQTAEQLAKRGLELVEELYGEDNLEGILFIQALNRIYEKQGKRSEVLFYAKKQRNILMKAYGEDHDETVGMSLMVGILHYENEEFEQALEIFEAHEKYLLKHPERPNIADELSYDYFLLATCYVRFEQWEKALDKFNKCLELKAKSEKNQDLLAEFYFRGAVLFHANHQYHQEIKNYFDKSIEIYESLGGDKYINQLNTVLTNYAHFLLHLKQYQESIKAFEKAVEYCKKIEPTPLGDLESLYNYLINLYVKEGQLEKSFWTCLEALDCCEKQNGGFNQITDYHEKLQSIYINLGAEDKLRVADEVGKRNGGEKIKSVLNI